MSARTVVVTGGTFGIGRSITVLLAEAGWHVVAFGVEGKQVGSSAQDGIAGTRKALAERGVAADLRELDVTDVPSLEALAAELDAEPSGLHGLVNCAAIRIPGRIEETSIEDFRRSVEVNLAGSFYTTKLLLSLLKKGDTGGSIVNVGSAAGWGRPALLAYGASKGGLFGLSAALAYDLKPDHIRVNVVVPGGGVLTGMTEEMGLSTEHWLAGGDKAAAGRPVTTEDVANAVVFLLSDESSQISGAILNVGGFINQGGGSFR